MRKNRDEMKWPPWRDKVHHFAPELASEPPKGSPPVIIQHVGEDAFATMKPGEIILLDEAQGLKCTIDPIFFAVIACPVCGVLGLITPGQYFGTVPIVCGSNTCSGRYRIVDESGLAYLPVN